MKLTHSAACHLLVPHTHLLALIFWYRLRGTVDKRADGPEERPVEGPQLEMFEKGDR